MVLPQPGKTLFSGIIASLFPVRRKGYRLTSFGVRFAQKASTVPGTRTVPVQYDLKYLKKSYSPSSPTVPKT